VNREGWIYIAAMIDDGVELLASCWQAWADAVAGFDEAVFERPTRCDGWTVRDVCAHATPRIDGLIALLRSPVDVPAAHTDAAELLRFFNTRGGPAETLAGTVADAARRAARAVNAAATSEAFRAAAAWVRGNSIAPDTVVTYPVAGTVTVAAVTDVALLEAVVHGLDVADAAGAPTLPAGAIAGVRDLLVRMTDAIALIDVATGRRPPDQLFPVVR
jgi:uncharacterized protein (TIGR03083 family)